MNWSALHNRGFAMGRQNTVEFTMEDVIEAMEAIQFEAGGKVTIDCELYPDPRGRQRVMWTATLVASPGGWVKPQAYTASQGWPTNTHRSVLALLWSLLHAVDQEFEASKAIATMQ